MLRARARSNPPPKCRRWEDNIGFLYRRPGNGYQDSRCAVGAWLWSGHEDDSLSLSWIAAQKPRIQSDGHCHGGFALAEVERLASPGEAHIEDPDDRVARRTEALELRVASLAEVGK